MRKIARLIELEEYSVWMREKTFIQIQRYGCLQSRCTQKETAKQKGKTNVLERKAMRKKKGKKGRRAKLLQKTIGNDEQVVRGEGDRVIYANEVRKYTY